MAKFNLIIFTLLDIVILCSFTFSHEQTNYLDGNKPYPIKYYYDVLDEMYGDGCSYYKLGGDSVAVEQGFSLQQGGWEHTILIPAKIKYKNKIYRVVSFADKAFESARIETVFLPETWNIISSGAFQSCYYLKHVYIPNSIKSIGNCAFERSGLDSITIPEGVKIIGTRSFRECKLEYVELPRSIEKINDFAFSYNYNLKCVKVHFTEPIEISKNVFFFTTPVNNIKLIVPVGCKEKFRNAYPWSIFTSIEEDADMK